MSPMTSNNGFVFPLWLQPDAANSRQSNLLDRGMRVNLGSAFLGKLRMALNAKPTDESDMPSGVTAEGIFQYAYAVFYSPTYRARYVEFLKTDFPRLPLTSSIELFRELARLGGTLVSLHLLEAPTLGQPRTKFLGDLKTEISRVAWADNTVWIDAPACRKGASQQPGNVGFEGVPEPVWNFHVGGYQVCEKWLKDRKGRTLSQDDVNHYNKIVVALAETIHMMGEIDKAIDKHGGWPGAFVTGGPAAVQGADGTPFA